MQGLICYKPVEQESCFLRKMDKSDYEHVHSLRQELTQKVSAWPHVSSGVFCFFVFAIRPPPLLPALRILEKQNTGTEEEVCPLSPAKCLFIHLTCKLAFSASTAKLKRVTERGPCRSSLALHGSLVTDEWRGAQSLEGKHIPRSLSLHG